MFQKLIPRFCRANMGWHFLLVWRILGKLPANFSANFFSGFSREWFGLVSLMFQAPPKNSRPEFTPRIVGIPLHFQIFEPTSISAYWGDRQTVFSVCLAIFLLKLTFCLTHSKRPKMGCSETVFKETPVSNSLKITSLFSGPFSLFDQSNIK